MNDMEYLSPHVVCVVEPCREMNEKEQEGMYLPSEVLRNWKRKYSCFHSIYVLTRNPIHEISW